MAQRIEAVVANRTETVTLGSKNSIYRFPNLGIQTLMSDFRDFPRILFENNIVRVATLPHSPQISLLNKLCYFIVRCILIEVEQFHHICGSHPSLMSGKF